MASFVGDFPYTNKKDKEFARGAVVTKETCARVTVVTLSDARRCLDLDGRSHLQRPPLGVDVRRRDWFHPLDDVRHDPPRGDQQSNRLNFREKVRKVSSLGSGEHDSPYSGDS